MATTTMGPVNVNNLEKIESFLKDPSYKEVIESSANFNTRLCIERRMRLPFLDSQTGVAQNHSNLFMHKRQRMPGLIQGQIYTYPRVRWRKKRRQYLTMNARAFARAADSMLDDDIHSISQVENPALHDTDSKDSQLLKDEVAKEWFYDEQDMLDVDPYDEPDPDSDLDYEESYKRSKKRRAPGRPRGGTDSPSTPGRKKGGGRGRKKAVHNIEPTPGDPDKPYACELCGARYKTRPGLTYHYGHSHREGASDDSRDSNAPTPSPSMGALGGPSPMPSGGQGGLSPQMGEGPLHQSGGRQPSAMPGLCQDSYAHFVTHAGTPGRRGRQPANPPPQAPPPSQLPPTLPPNLPSQLPPLEDGPMPVLVPEKPVEIPSSSSQQPGPEGTSTVPGAPPLKDGKPAPSPYCDFCLGNSRENKKTGTQEELVSCADCGRSGHPSCLQFTANMMISVKKYNWQCIECKCCSMCGTSDNDDQLLFCDDCDRGYHMYCLQPPMRSAPEGSWSCKLCISVFHK